jgi:hypothetical protein
MIPAPVLAPLRTKPASLHAAKILSRNLITLRYGEFPTPRFDRDLNAIELDNLDGLYTHARQAALGDGLGNGKSTAPMRRRRSFVLTTLAVRQNGRSGYGPLRDRHRLSGDRMTRHKP